MHTKSGRIRFRILGDTHCRERPTRDRDIAMLFRDCRVFDAVKIQIPINKRMDHSSACWSEQDGAAMITVSG